MVLQHSNATLPRGFLPVSAATSCPCPHPSHNKGFGKQSHTVVRYPGGVIPCPFIIAWLCGRLRMSCLSNACCRHISAAVNDGPELGQWVALDSAAETASASRVLLYHPILPHPGTGSCLSYSSSLPRACTSSWTTSPRARSCRANNPGAVCDGLGASVAARSPASPTSTGTWLVGCLSMP